MHAANSVAPEDSEAEDCPLPVEQLFNYHRVKESATYVGLAVLALYAPLGIILGCVRILLLALHLLVLRALPATVSQHSQLYVAGRVRARTHTHDSLPGQCHCMRNGNAGISVSFSSRYSDGYRTFARSVLSCAHLFRSERLYTRICFTRWVTGRAHLRTPNPKVMVMNHASNFGELGSLSLPCTHTAALSHTYPMHAHHH